MSETKLVQPTWKHARSRFQCVTEGVIHQLQGDFFAGRSLEGSIPDLSSDQAAIIVAESLEADIIWNLDPQELLQGAVKKRRECDFWSAALAEILFSVSDSAREIKKSEASKNWWAVAMASLEKIATSSTASPMLDYEAIFWELSQNSRDETNEEAIQWLEKSLAHTLRFDEGEGAVFILRDLAELYLEVGQFDQGLRIMTAVLRQDPADIWTYNVIGISFDRYSLPKLGSQAIQRGLQLIETRGDPEGLRNQLNDFQKRMEAAMEKSLESQATPMILKRFQEALQLSFDADQSVPPALLCRELVPHLEKIPVKRPLTSRDFPLPNPEHILTYLLEDRKEIPKGKSRRRHKKRGA
jgi:tetratricopeptide (TPR) repeat protein